MTAYYNENDPKAAAWLRELIKGGHIAPGEVDERSIEDVRPGELAGYRQCHFFAGIGGWSYALRLAGVADSERVWTGSCPCQPFSAAGKGAGFADERHLWPSWLHLVRACKPPVIFGEQVANALEWLDLVSTDLEGEGYSCGAAVIGAHSVGAPHIRQRLYWVADSGGQRQQQHKERDSQPGRGIEASRRSDADGRRELGNLEHAQSDGRIERRPESSERGIEPRCEFSDVGNPEDQWLDGEPGPVGKQQKPAGGSSLSNVLGHAGGERLEGWILPRGGRANERAAWTPSDLVWCRDGKWRPIESGTFPLAHGVSGRVGLLRGYGNAIVPQDGATFIEACGGLA